MFDDLGESNVVMFTVTTVFIKTFDGTDFLFFLEESSQLREIDNEKPANNCHCTCNSAFNNKDEAPACILACVNPR